jgi:hypothetical protein
MTPWELLSTCQGLRAWLSTFAARHSITAVFERSVHGRRKPADVELWKGSIGSGVERIDDHFTA